MNDKYLLIIPCSKRKIETIQDKVVALDLYDGPFYRIIRKNFREYGELNNLDIGILSAKYGLIPSYEHIAYYDQKMTANRARELSASIKKILTKQLRRNDYREIFINVGKSYMLALETCSHILNSENVVSAHGMIGERMQQLKTWMINLPDRQTNDTME
jgi:predicted RNA-binding protein